MTNFEHTEPEQILEDDTQDLQLTVSRHKLRQSRSKSESSSLSSRSRVSNPQPLSRTKSCPSLSDEMNTLEKSLRDSPTAKGESDDTTITETFSTREEKETTFMKTDEEDIQTEKTTRLSFVISRRYTRTLDERQSDASDSNIRESNIQTFDISLLQEKAIPEDALAPVHKKKSKIRNGDKRRPSILRDHENRESYISDDKIHFLQDSDSEQSKKRSTYGMAKSTLGFGSQPPRKETDTTTLNKDWTSSKECQGPKTTRPVITEKLVSLMGSKVPKSQKAGVSGKRNTSLSMKEEETIATEGMKSTKQAVPETSVGQPPISKGSTSASQVKEFCPKREFMNILLSSFSDEDIEKFHKSDETYIQKSPKQVHISVVLTDDVLKCIKTYPCCKDPSEHPIKEKKMQPVETDEYGFLLQACRPLKGLKRPVPTKNVRSIWKCVSPTLLRDPRECDGEEGEEANATKISFHGEFSQPSRSYIPPDLLRVRSSQLKMQPAADGQGIVTRQSGNDYDGSENRYEPRDRQTQKPKDMRKARMKEDLAHSIKGEALSVMDSMIDGEKLEFVTGENLAVKADEVKPLRFPKGQFVEQSRSQKTSSLYSRARTLSKVRPLWEFAKKSRRDRGIGSERKDISSSKTTNITKDNIVPKQVRKNKSEVSNGPDDMEEMYWGPVLRKSVDMRTVMRQLSSFDDSKPSQPTKRMISRKTKTKTKSKNVLGKRR